MARYEVAAARVLVNQARVAAGAPALLDLPRGRRRVEVDCPLQNALEAVGCIALNGARLTFARPEQAAIAATAWNVEVGGLCGLNIVTPNEFRHFIALWDDDEIAMSDLRIAG